MTYADLTAALRVLGLGERASLKEIKARYHKLVRRFHPDAGGEQGSERLQRVNAAYQVLQEYVRSYRFSFSEEEFYEQNPDERLRRQFTGEWLK